MKLEHRHHAPDTEIDRAIDEVARRLTAAEPSAQLRRRVLSQIDDRIASRGEARSRTRWTWRLAPAIAAVATAVIVIAISTKRTSVMTPAVPSASDARPISSGSLPTAPETSATPTEIPGRRAIETASIDNHPRTQNQHDAISEDELGWRERAVAALPRPGALEVDSIQPEPLAIPLLEMKPLAPAPLGAAGSDKAGL